MVNTVIIGAGDIARKRHIPALLQAKSGKLYGFYNRTWETTDALARKYQVKAYHSLREVLVDPAVRAVLISTPPCSHTDLAIQALQAGKYVLLEKPMTLTVEDAQRIVEAEKLSDARVTMLHVQRYYAPHIRAKELLERGEIGKLLTVRTYLGNSDPGVFSGAVYPEWDNALFNIGIHRIDLLRWLVGEEAQEVFCHRSRFLLPPGGALDDHSASLIQFKNGVLATMIASRISFHGEDRSTVLIGTEGTLTTYAHSHELLLEKLNGEKAAFDFPGSHVQGIWELTDLHERFFRSIEDGTEPEVDAQAGLQSVRIAAALERSNEERRWIQLDEI